MMEAGTDAVEVTQADRDAAVKIYSIIRGEDMSHVALGKGDAILQAFACHRLAAQSPTEDEVGKSDALAKALCLLDTFAGEGLGHVYGNGQSLDADDVCAELAAAFGIECEPGWYRTVAIAALRLGQIIPNSDPVETAGEVVTSVESPAEKGGE